ncbi:hypothetical protein MTO96_049469 [Rhipicephalus appendiculatus]
MVSFRRGQLELSGGGGSEDEHGGGARSPAAGAGPVRGAAGTPPAPQQSPLRPTPSPGAAPPGPGGGGTPATGLGGEVHVARHRDGVLLFRAAAPCSKQQQLPFGEERESGSRSVSRLGGAGRFLRSSFSSSSSDVFAVARLGRRRRLRRRSAACCSLLHRSGLHPPSPSSALPSYRPSGCEPALPPPARGNTAEGRVTVLCTPGAAVVVIVVGGVLEHARDRPRRLSLSSHPGRGSGRE